MNVATLHNANISFYNSMNPIHSIKNEPILDSESFEDQEPLVCVRRAKIFLPRPSLKPDITIYCGAYFEKLPGPAARFLKIMEPNKEAVLNYQYERQAELEDLEYMDIFLALSWVREQAGSLTIHTPPNALASFLSSVSLTEQEVARWCSENREWPGELEHILELIGLIKARSPHRVQFIELSAAEARIHRRSAYPVWKNKGARVNRLLRIGRTSHRRPQRLSAFA